MSSRTSVQGKLLYAQSGGVTAVINATAAGVIETARERGVKVYAARHGILGALREDLIDTSKESAAAIAALRHTPGGAFGSCRYKLKPLREEHTAYEQMIELHGTYDSLRYNVGLMADAYNEYERLIEVCRAHDIRWFLYNGGNDSADTALKLSRIGQALDYDLCCIGIPKTIDNDLAITDCCPGFGSVAKYTAISTLEASFDVASMSETSTRVFILEVMGRHAGWIAAAAGLAAQGKADAAPHIILFPEKKFDEHAFLTRVKATVDRVGWCTVVTAEGIRNTEGQFLAEAGSHDTFGHPQLGGVAPVLAEQVRKKLGYKCHWALPDYLQRAAHHVVSAVDARQAYAVGREAVHYALEGMNSVMPVIVRTADQPYRWEIEPAPLAKIANHEKKMPRNFIRRDGFGITAAARRYLKPLIVGEASPPYGKNGLPKYISLKNLAVPPLLAAFTP